MFYCNRKTKLKKGIFIAFFAVLLYNAFNTTEKRKYKKLRNGELNYVD